MQDPPRDKHQATDRPDPHRHFINTLARYLPAWFLFLTVNVSAVTLQITFFAGNTSLPYRPFAKPWMRIDYWLMSILLVAFLLSEPPLTRFARRMFLLVWGYTVATGIVAEFYALLAERGTAVVMVIIASLVQVVSLILLLLELWRRRAKSQ